jgi:hypothetical protein
MGGNKKGALWCALRCGDEVLIVRLGSHAQVRLDFGNTLGEALLGFFRRNGGGNHNIVTVFPIYRGGHAVVIGQLQRI